MTTCTVRWRPSRGRGEFEFVPADSLEERFVHIFLEPLGITIPADVFGTKAQGKPRLRKVDKSRRKMHLPQLVMAIARLPEPARQDKFSTVSFPLENKRFVMDSMDFEVVDDDGDVVTLAPLRVTILHSDFTVNLQDRLLAIANDLTKGREIRQENPTLADAVEDHFALLKAAQNTTQIRKQADLVISLQTEVYGPTNAGSIVALRTYSKLPPTELEEPIPGIEGKLLARIHYYKERDRGFADRARSYYRSKQGGVLTCEVCRLESTAFYGHEGEACIEIHHKTPISQLQPDSVTVVEDVAVLCASCHRMIHSATPCLELDRLREVIALQKVG